MLKIDLLGSFLVTFFSLKGAKRWQANQFRISNQNQGHRIALTLTVNTAKLAGSTRATQEKHGIGDKISGARVKATGTSGELMSRQGRAPHPSMDRWCRPLS
jgi:hypothetical protein